MIVEFLVQECQIAGLVIPLSDKREMKMHRQFVGYAMEALY